MLKNFIFIIGSLFLMSCEQNKPENHHSNHTRITEIMDQHPLHPYDTLRYNIIDSNLSENLPVNITIQYTPHLFGQNNKYYYALIKSNNIAIGENFISISFLGSLQASYRNIASPSYGEDYTDYTNPMRLWNQERDRRIFKDSLINPTFLANFSSSAHTVSFTLQKDAINNFNISNLALSNLNLNTNQFTLNNNQYRQPYNSAYDAHFTRKLLLTFTCLFSNFEKSKEIFD